MKKDEIKKIQLMSDEQLNELQAKLINLSLNEVNYDIQRCEDDRNFEGVKKYLEVKYAIDTVLEYISKCC